MIESIIVFDGRHDVDVAVGVTGRETGKDESFFVVVFTENLVVTQIVAVSHAEPTTASIDVKP